MGFFLESLPQIHDVLDQMVENPGKDPFHSHCLAFPSDFVGVVSGFGKGLPLTWDSVDYAVVVVVDWEFFLDRNVVVVVAVVVSPWDVVVVVVVVVDEAFSRPYG